MEDINGLQILLRGLTLEGPKELVRADKCGEYTLYSSKIRGIYLCPIRISISTPPNLSSYASAILALSHLPEAF